MQMFLYHAQVQHRDGTIENIILNAVDSVAACHTAREGLSQDGVTGHYAKSAKKVSKAKAYKLVDAGARQWASI